MYKNQNSICMLAQLIFIATDICGDQLLMQFKAK